MSKRDRKGAGRLPRLDRRAVGLDAARGLEAGKDVLRNALVGVNVGLRRQGSRYGGKSQYHHCHVRGMPRRGMME